MKPRTLVRRLALAAATACALALVPAAASTGRYVDSTGDSGTAPDITGVTVVNEANGQILFTISFASLPAPADVRTYLLLDTDLSSTTGALSTHGADYAFLMDDSDNSWDFARWNGTTWDDSIPYSSEPPSSRSGARDGEGACGHTSDVVRMGCWPSAAAESL